MTPRFTMIVLLTATLFIGAGCSTADNAATQQKVQAIAVRKFGNDFKLIPNSSNDFLLCIRNEKLRPGTQPVRFFVYSLEKDSVVYERELDNGSVRWLNSTKLSITHIPGNVTGDENADKFNEVYDLATAKVSGH